LVKDELNESIIITYFSVAFFQTKKKYGILKKMQRDKGIIENI
jgi:hypothetical protein